MCLHLQCRCRPKRISLFDLTIDLNGGTYDDDIADIVEEVEEGQNILEYILDLLNTNLLLKDGYVYGGASYDEAGLQEVGIDEVVEDDVKVYIQWVAAYTITFDFGGGTHQYYEEDTSMDVTLIPAGNLLIGYAPSTSGDIIDLTKDGYIFDDWYYEDTFTTPVGAEDLTPADDITIYAKWILDET